MFVFSIGMIDQVEVPSRTIREDPAAAPATVDAPMLLWID
jgi:hypothetical protein